MHLAVVSPFPPAITGIGQYGYHVTRALEKSGSFSRITVLAGSHLNGVQPNHLGKTELDYCWEPGQSKTRQVIMSGLKRLNPDVVWFNCGVSIFGRSALSNLSGLITPMVTRNLGFPTVVTMHELVELTDLQALNAPGGPFAKIGARLLTTITSQADVLCLTMQRYVDLLASRGVNCTHIPIGAYHEPELLEETPDLELLFFTTLAPFKGLEILLHAFQQLRARHPELRLTIAGTRHIRFPGYAEELKARFSDVPGIRWIGHTAEENVIELFRRAHVIVLPYTASTGSSSVLYQAATWGRAVVASDLPETKELVKEGNLKVMFFRSRNIQDLHDAINKLLLSRQLRIEQTTHNFNAIQSAHPMETGRKYIRAFNLALEKKNSTKRIKLHTLENAS